MKTTAEKAVDLALLGDKIDEQGKHLKELNAEYEVLEKLLIEEFEQEKISGITIVGNGERRAVSLGKKFFAKRREEFDQEAVYDALLEAGVDELAQRGYNANTLTAWLKRHLEEKDASLHPALAKVLDVKEHPRISIRKA